jgi:4a-hydroxytetrahydrobiopterin dehydratase
MAVPRLSEDEISNRLKERAKWQREGNEILRQFQFTGFMDSISFVNQVAAHAESVDHHPDILVQYNKVTLRLSTHDANGISQKDFEFAAVADSLAHD